MTQRPRGPARAIAAAALVALGMAACTDPRPRPAPPTVQLTLAVNLYLTSPGELAASLYASDPNGIDSINVSVRSADGRLTGDSTWFLSGSDPFQTTHPILWQVPQGLAIGTAVQVVARVVSYIGFAASDTVITAVQDTLPGGS